MSTSNHQRPIPTTLAPWLAVRDGAAAVAPVAEEHGWRSGRLRDPFGHDWEIGRPLGR